MYQVLVLLPTITEARQLPQQVLDLLRLPAPRITWMSRIRSMTSHLVRLHDLPQPPSILCLTDNLAHLVLKVCTVVVGWFLTFFFAFAHNFVFFFVFVLNACWFTSSAVVTVTLVSPTPPLFPSNLGYQRSCSYSPACTTIYIFLRICSTTFNRNILLKVCCLRVIEDRC